MTFLTFEEWCEKNQDLTKTVTTKYPRCDGVGELECSECGQMYVCPDCESGGHITGDHDKNTRLKKLYLDRLKAEKEKLSGWVQSRPIQAAET